MPQQPQTSLDDTLKQLRMHVKGLEEGALLAFRGELVVGWVMVSNLLNADEATMVGGVRPEACGHGIGRALLDRASRVARANACKRMRTAWFQSNERAIAFMTTAGFAVQDRKFWSTFDTASIIPSWALAKESSVLQRGIRVITGAKFESVRSDWAQVWWKHFTQCVKDIPAKTTMGDIPFERWRPLIESPFVDRNNVLIALEGNELVGMLYLGSPNSARVNINHTSVARTHRRQGISVLLKCAAVRHARAQQVETIDTQNHEKNPMFELNQAFGFTHIETELCGVIEL
jgi:GNAT superfamily N-acetyltransferase